VTITQQRPHANVAVDLDKIARNMVETAVAVTTGRMQMTSPLDVRDCLLAGDTPTVNQFRAELTRQIAAAMLWIDPNVIAVYEEQDALAEADGVSNQGGLSDPQPIRILIEVESQTPALRAIIGALDEALCNAVGSLLPEPLCGVRGYLDAILIDTRNSRLLTPSAQRHRRAFGLLAARDNGMRW
jgi:hypothetical protein